MKLHKSMPAVAVPPILEYETTHVKTASDDDTEKLDRFINAKAENGWRLQELHRIDDGNYLVVLFKFKGEVLGVLHGG